MNIADLLIVAFATFAAAFVFKYIDGPCLVFKKSRRYIDAKFPKLFKKLFDCFWCLGFWIGIVTLAMYIYIPEIVYCFCVLGAVGYMHERLA